MAVFVIKQLDIVAGAGEVVFDSDTPEFERLKRDLVHNFVDISSATTPTAGTFTTYVETVENGGFHDLEDVPVIDATKIGAGVADGAAVRSSFLANAYRIKIVAAGVTGVTSVEVVISGNLT